MFQDPELFPADKECLLWSQKRDHLIFQTVKGYSDLAAFKKRKRKKKEKKEKPTNQQNKQTNKKPTRPRSATMHKKYMYTQYTQNAS